MTYLLLSPEGVARAGPASEASSRLVVTTGPRREVIAKPLLRCVHDTEEIPAQSAKDAVLD
jgi:hypothetical protein